MGDTAASELAGDLAGPGVEHHAHLIRTGAGFAQHGFADNRIHVGFAEVDTHLEAAQQLLKILKLIQSLPAAADEEQPPIEISGEAFGDILHIQDAPRIVFEELLDLIEDDQCQR